jgi:Ca-activated chloride channel family protein
MKTATAVRLMFLPLLLSAGMARGAGVLIPKDESLPPLSIRHQRVDVTITDGAAETRVEQVFHNSTDRDLEASYIFPLPPGAAIADFAMFINGKRMSGELVEKDKARAIYEEIVRRMKDPGILERMDDNLFRVRVYPVPKNGDQKFELRYSQTLDFEAGLFRYVYPLKTGEKAAQLLEDFTLSVNLRSRKALRTVYSPTHEVGVTRKGDHEAIAGFEKNKALLDRDFELYYGVSDKEFGLNLLTHRREGEDGYFLMMLCPPVEPPGGKPLPRDIVFAFDTSGSMQGVKIEQARKALEHCLGTLREEDRFNVVRFSTDVEAFRDKLAPASAENRKAAAEFVRKFDARGGTAIHEALKTALASDFDRARPNLVVFLTDGRPTIGETETDAIAKAAAGGNDGKARLFVFGVGDEVNAVLLDRLSAENGGVCRYVRQDEDIEVKVSSLAEKISRPVMAKVAVAVDKIKTLQMHPKDLPELFAGEQLTVFGRYQGDGHVAIRLTGEVMGEKREFVFEESFPAKSEDNAFIPRLWATRRVGYLLEEIRVRGEQKELKDEVVALGKEHGIMTPYTSYLVLEDDAAYGQHGIPRGGEDSAERRRESAERERREQSFRGAGSGGSYAHDALVPMPADEPDTRSFNAMSEAAGRVAARPASPSPSVMKAPAQAQAGEETLALESGSRAIDVSTAIQEYKKADTRSLDPARMRRVESKVFYGISGVWVDSDYKKGGSETKVTFGSDEYFRLLREKPELKPFFALGEKVIVVLKDVTYVVE